MSNGERQAETIDKTKETEPTQAEDTADRLMTSVFDAIKSNATKASNEEFSLGQVNNIDIPKGWKPGAEHIDMQHTSTYKEYHPENDPKAQLGFYYRGHRTSEAAGKSFKEVLDKPAHALTNEELQKVQDTLRDKTNPKDFTGTARTEDINGKRVLVVEGKFNKINQETKHIYVDSDGTGTAVQEIFFQAETAKFKQYSKEAEAAFKSIGWK